MKSVAQKRRGRPATGWTPIIALRLPAEEIQSIDQFAAEQKITRSNALRLLLREGYEACRRRGRREEIARKREETTIARTVEQVLAETAVPEPEPVIVPQRRPGYRRVPTAEEVKAAADRAEARRKT